MTSDISLLERTTAVRAQLDETGRILDLVSERLTGVRIEQEQYVAAVFEQEAHDREERLSAVDHEVEVAEEEALDKIAQIEANVTAMESQQSDDLFANVDGAMPEATHEVEQFSIAPESEAVTEAESQLPVDGNVTMMPEPMADLPEDAWDAIESTPDEPAAPIRRLADVVSLRPLAELDESELTDEERAFEKRFTDFADGDTDDASRRWLTG